MPRSSSGSLGKLSGSAMRCGRTLAAPFRQSRCLPPFARAMPIA